MAVICEMDELAGAIGALMCSGDVTYELTFHRGPDAGLTLTLCAAAARHAQTLMIIDREDGPPDTTLRRIDEVSA